MKARTLHRHAVQTLDAMAAQLDTMTATITELRQANTELRKTITQLKTSNADMHRRLASLRRRHDLMDVEAAVHPAVDHIANTLEITRTDLHHIVNGHHPAHIHPAIATRARTMWHAATERTTR